MAVWGTVLRTACPRRTLSVCCTMDYMEGHLAPGLPSLSSHISPCPPCSPPPSLPSQAGPPSTLRGVRSSFVPISLQLIVISTTPPPLPSPPLLLPPTPSSLLHLTCEGSGRRLRLRFVRGRVSEPGRRAQGTVSVEAFCNVCVCVCVCVCACACACVCTRTCSCFRASSHLLCTNRSRCLFSGVHLNAGKFQAYTQCSGCVFFRRTRRGATS